MLQRRLEYSYPHVDLFVILEATQTYSGQPKNLTFQANQDRFRPYEDKIVHFVDTNWVEPDFSKLYNSTPENAYYIQQIKRDYHRQVILNSDLLSFQNHDIIWYCDVDEIIDHTYPDLVSFLETWNGRGVIYNEQQDYVYDYHCSRSPNGGWQWHKSFFLTYQTLHYTNLHQKRMACDSPSNKKVRSGWHLTYFMTMEEMRHKIRSGNDLIPSASHLSRENIQKILTDDSHLLHLIRNCIVPKAKLIKSHEVDISNVDYRPPGFDDWISKYRSDQLFWQKNESP